MPIKISKDSGAALDGTPPNKVIIALVQQNCRAAMTSVAAFTDSGGGTDNKAVYLNAPVANVAATGSNLADKTTSEAAAATVKNALTELAAKANEYATLLGIPTFTNSIGGTTADGTIDAVTKTVTGDTGGIQASNTNTYIAAVNKLLSSLAGKVNALRRSAGLSEVAITFRSTAVEPPAVVSTLPALVVNSLGTEGSPGVTKAAFDAVLLDQANSIKALSVALDGITATATPLIIVG